MAKFLPRPEGSQVPPQDLGFQISVWIWPLASAKPSVEWHKMFPALQRLSILVSYTNPHLSLGKKKVELRSVAGKQVSLQYNTNLLNHQAEIAWRFATLSIFSCTGHWQQLRSSYCPDSRVMRTVQWLQMEGVGYICFRAAPLSLLTTWTALGQFPVVCVSPTFSLTCSWGNPLILVLCGAWLLNMSLPPHVTSWTAS